MSQSKKFTLEVHEPYSTFTEGRPTPIPYVIDGLLPKAAFSVLGGKAKHGKSSMSRIEAVAVTKGQPFLNRPTERGEVLLCSLEDPRQHVDNCLSILGHTKADDARIHIVTKLPRDVSETVDNLSDYIRKNQDINLVVLDTLAKVLRAKDSGNYDEMLLLCEQLHLLARETGVHIQALAHCKKVATEDPFDAFLGSVEIRAEADTNIALFDSHGKRLIQSETRMGTAWEATEIHAELAAVGNSQMVKQFYFGDTLAKSTEDMSAAQERNTRLTIKSRIVASLKEHNGETRMGECLDNIAGRKQLKYEVRDELIETGIISMVGVPHAKDNPLRLKLLKPDWTPSAVKVGPERTIPPNVVETPEVVEKSSTQLERERIERNLRDLRNKLTRYAGVPRPDIEEDIARYQAQLDGIGGTPCVN